MTIREVEEAIDLERSRLNGLRKMELPDDDFMTQVFGANWRDLEMSSRKMLDTIGGFLW